MKKSKGRRPTTGDDEPRGTVKKFMDTCAVSSRLGASTHAKP
jgi:hypothetical protein